MNKFRNNKITMVIGQLSPLLLLLFWFVDIEHNDLYEIIGIVITVAVAFCIFILVIISRNDNDYSFLHIRKCKIVYSKYGQFFLVTTSSPSIGSHSYQFKLYTNKNWLWLNSISNSIYFDGEDYEDLKEKTIKMLNRSIEKNKKSMSSHDKFKKWNGSLDKITERERNIDKII